MDNSWQKALANAEKAGFHSFGLGDHPPTPDELVRVSAHPVPQAVLAFADLWARPGREPWQILVQSAVTVNTAIDGSHPSLRSFRQLVERAGQAALLWDQQGTWASPQRWGYLLQIQSRNEGDKFGYLTLHPPATFEDLTAAQEIINVQLPPSYQGVLLLTNGLGIRAQESSFLCGAGPQRAAWATVKGSDWLDCDHMHEIAANWRLFYGVYSDEGFAMEPYIREALNNKTLIPFAETYDTWCFDRSRQSQAGEYPIGIWDHETCEITFAYTNIGEWIQHEFIPYMFG